MVKENIFVLTSYSSCVMIFGVIYRYVFVFVVIFDWFWGMWCVRLKLEIFVLKDLESKMFVVFKFWCIMFISCKYVMFRVMSTAIRIVFIFCIGLFLCKYFSKGFFVMNFVIKYSFDFLIIELMYLIRFACLRVWSILIFWKKLSRVDLISFCLSVIYFSVILMWMICFFFVLLG